MSDPLALVPFAVAAGGGQLGGVPASQLVAAGVTLLQRAAPLVRALAGRRSAVLLPPTTPTNTPAGAWLVALAASDGRGMVVLAPAANGGRLPALCEMHHIGALFTTRHTLEAWQADVPRAMPVVLLDDAPASARVQSADGALDRLIDLGTHFGIPVEGDPAVDGADEECLVMVDGETTQVLTHRAVLRAARSQQPTPLDVVPGVLAHMAPSRLPALITEVSTLLAGGHVAGSSALPM
jgi:hypothetical protein